MVCIQVVWYFQMCALINPPNRVQFKCLWKKDSVYPSFFKPDEKREKEKWNEERVFTHFEWHVDLKIKMNGKLLNILIIGAERVYFFYKYLQKSMKLCNEQLCNINHRINTKPCIWLLIQCKTHSFIAIFPGKIPRGMEIKQNKTKTEFMIIFAQQVEKLPHCLCQNSKQLQKTYTLMKRESDTRIEFKIYISRHIFAYQKHLSFGSHSV